MIQYTLKCSAGHQFESWFQSASAFEALEKAGHLACALCGGVDVQKAIMAPNVAITRDASAPTSLSKPASDGEKKLAEMRKHIEENADYVGSGFAKEARDMFLGETPERAVYGEANGAEAKALIEDGIPVVPLPFLPNRKAN